MKFQVEREALADAVAWIAKSLPARPPVPVLAGALLEVENQRLTISGFDYEVSSQMGVDVQGDASGQTLVSGRLLAEITRALPSRPVSFSAGDARVEITCGSARFTLPTMPVEDYPELPAMPTVAGAINGDDFASAVRQVAVAAGRDDTLPMLTGVQLEMRGERLSMIATDRYRLAVRELTWRPGVADLQRQALVPARTLAETAKALGGAGDVAVALSEQASGGGLIGFSGAGKRTTTRLLDNEYPPVRSLLPENYVAAARLSVSALTEVVKRVSLVAERNTPIRFTFAEGVLTVEAGTSEDARASESMEAHYTGEEMMIAFNPEYLLDGLGAIATEFAMLSFTTPLKPAVLAAASGDEERGYVEDAAFRYVLMPVRFSH